MNKYKIGIFNAKGGTAKTTTTINVAHGLANKGKTVLIVDLDPQASASVSLGFKNALLTIGDVLLEALPVKKAIQKTVIGGVDILPGSMSLASFDITFANVSGRETRLKEILNQTNYDIILFDCPPTLGLLPINAINASDKLIVPVIPQYLSLEGLATLMDALDCIKSGMGSKAEILGILLTQVDRRSKANKEIITLLRKHFGVKVFDTEISINTKIAEAPSFGKSIFQHDCFATGAVAYQKLTEEILIRLSK